MIQSHITQLLNDQVNIGSNLYTTGFISIIVF